jgi:hypothetical protein
MRRRLRMIVFSVVPIVIVLAAIFEPPGVTEGVGYAVVFIIMVLLLLRERTRPS